MSHLWVIGLQCLEITRLNGEQIGALNRVAQSKAGQRCLRSALRADQAQAIAPLLGVLDDGPRRLDARLA